MTQPDRLQKLLLHAPNTHLSNKLSIPIVEYELPKLSVYARISQLKLISLEPPSILSVNKCIHSKFEFFFGKEKHTQNGFIIEILSRYQTTKDPPVPASTKPI